MTLNPTNFHFYFQFSSTYEKKSMTLNLTFIFIFRALWMWRMVSSTTSGQHVASQPDNWISHESQKALLFLLISLILGNM